MEGCVRSHGALKKVLMALQAFKHLRVPRLPAIEPNDNSDCLIFVSRARVAATVGMPCQPVKTAVRTCQSFHLKTAEYPISRVRVLRDWNGIQSVRDTL